MAKDRIETPPGSTGAKYLDGLAALLLRRGAIERMTANAYAITCAGVPGPLDCAASLTGKTPREVVDMMAAYGWSIVPGVMGAAPKVCCREHGK